MKKVLIIGYPFPLRMGGSPRLLGLAKYLPEFGWQPVILTAPLDRQADGRFRIVETPYRDALAFWKKMFRIKPGVDMRRQMKERFGVTSRKSVLDFFLTRAGEIANYPDHERGWKPFAIAAGERLFREEKIDAIISTSAPVTTHLIARKLKRRHCVPWVADLRDLWSQNHNYGYSQMRRWFDRRLERKTFAEADALVTVSKSWAKELGALHRGKAVHAITNGFDPEKVNVPPARLTDKFTITYTGGIYARKIDPADLFTALKEFLQDGAVEPGDIEVRYYGTIADWVEREIRDSGLTGIVRQYGRVSQEAAIEKQRESQVLFLIKWQDPHDTGVYSGKIFEYLAARRPILALGGVPDVVTDLLGETGAGMDARSVPDIKEALRKLYREYKQHGEVAYHGVASEIDKYSHREMARRFSEVLERQDGVSYEA